MLRVGHNSCARLALQVSSDAMISSAGDGDGELSNPKVGKCCECQERARCSMCKRGGRYYLCSRPRLLICCAQAIFEETGDDQHGKIGLRYAGCEVTTARCVARERVRVSRG